MALITPLPACMSFRHRAGESNLAAIVPPPKNRFGIANKNQKLRRNLLFLINYSPQQNLIAAIFGAPRESLHIAINVEPAAPASKKLLTQQQRRIKRASGSIQLTRVWESSISQLPAAGAWPGKNPHVGCCLGNSHFFASAARRAAIKYLPL